MAWPFDSGGTAGNLTNSSGTNGAGWTSPGYGVEKKATASLDPTGYSETKDAYNDISNLGKGAWNWAKGAWNTFSGKDSYRAPEKVFDPWSTYDGSQSQEGRAAAATQYNNLTGQGGPNAYYQGLMNGKSPSLAENQMRQGIAQAQKQGMQTASGARGIDRAAAFRNAQNNSANLTGQAAIAGGQQRLQEQQLGAQGYSQGVQAASNMANTGRQMDISEQQGLMGLENTAQQNLNQQYQINAGISEGNATRQQKAAGGVTQLAGAALGALSDIRSKEDIQPAGSTNHGTFAPYSGPDPNAMARAMAPGVTASAPAASSPLASALSSYGRGSSNGADNGQMFNAQDSANFGAAAQNIAGTGDGGGMLGGLMGGGGGGITSMLSDENSKEALKGVHPYQFDYKDRFAHEMGMNAAKDAYAKAFLDAKTPRVGVMAQDLARNPEARSTVTTDPQSGMLAIDGKRALGFMLANQADFNDRLKAIEGSKRGRAA